jgi:hypothetical protein
MRPTGLRSAGRQVQKGQCFMNLDQIDEYAPFYDIARLARTGR